MWLRLALKWGCSPREAQDRLTSYEFGELMALYNMEPWDNSRQEIVSALQTAGIVQCLLKQEIDWHTFAPFIEKPKVVETEQDEDSLKGIFEGLK